VVEERVAVGSKDIEQWIRGQVIKRHKASGKAICPFAKKVIEDKTFSITPAKSNVLAQINQCCSLFSVLGLDIVILYFNHRITRNKIKNICQKAHEQHPNFAILYDHPDNKGLHKGVSFSFKKAPLIMIQDLRKLKEAQKILRKSGWYEAWGLADFEMFY
tara:strand:+ start:951 stop:1430 length:480 start_codon:yes stop_codon:yes gene_type:complete